MKHYEALIRHYGWLVSIGLLTKMRQCFAMLVTALLTSPLAVPHIAKGHPCCVAFSTQGFGPMDRAAVRIVMAELAAVKNGNSFN